MTRVTTDPTLESLAEFIERFAAFGDGGDRADWLAEETDYVEKRDTHNTCRYCNADVSRLRVDEGVEITCHEHRNDHTYLLDPADVFAHRLNPEAVLRDVAAELGYDDIGGDVEQTPEYAVVSASERVRLALLLRPERYERAVDELFADAVKNGRVNAIFTPTDFEDLDWGSALRKPLAGAAPPFPLGLLSDTRDEIRRQLESATDALQRRELAFSEADAGTDLLRHLNQNPRATQFELEYAPIFRSAGSSGTQRLSTRFEEVCSAAFETLGFPDQSDSLGTSSRGANLPDILFTIRSDSRYPKNRGGKKILGIVDAKSNAEANIGKEEIVNKHAEYLQQANTDAFDDHHLAHIFVVLSMEGHEANEIKWYDAIEANFHGQNVVDISMVVLYADALAHMLDIHLSATQQNEANLSVGDVRDVFRPFFNYRGFKRGVDRDIRAITRVDGRDSSTSGENYREEYKQRERLLVVTREMVDKHYRRTIDDHDLTGGLLSNYGDVL